MTIIAAPDPLNAIRILMLANSTVKSAAETGASGSAIFSYGYPAKTAQQSIDYAAELAALTRRLVLIRPAGRKPLQTQGNALIGAPRFDVWNYGRTPSDAAALYWITHAFLKQLADQRATLTGGQAGIRSITVEAGPFSFTDQDTNAPVVVGTYAAIAAEAFAA